ncbi:hypothetical protein AB1Y20_014116 [Prymnesium parvum]|uniref:RING-type domain-containing protein n=1 Tax=Prymnesium parvum TaxID=97485 RepID=A0AB34IHI1_PRYPA
MDTPENDDDLVCTICFGSSSCSGRYTGDVLLTQCGHPFCHTCLSAYVDQRRQAKLRITCPVCRQLLTEWELSRVEMVGVQAVSAGDAAPRRLSHRVVLRRNIGRRLEKLRHSVSSLARADDAARTALRLERLADRQIGAQLEEWRWQTERDVPLVLLGPRGAGKDTFLRSFLAHERMEPRGATLRFQIRKTTFALTNPAAIEGGSERKYFHVFDNARALIFMADVSGLARRVAAERTSANQHETTTELDEALLYFDSLMAQHFRSTPVILLLNKMDALEQQLETIPLREVLPAYRGSGSLLSVARYVLSLFVAAAVRTCPNRSVYSFFTMATLGGTFPTEPEFKVWRFAQIISDAHVAITLDANLRSNGLD